MKRGARCRDCKAELGDVELYERDGDLYCEDDYQERFGTSPQVDFEVERAAR